MRVATVQVRQRGTMTLPSKMRAKYGIEEGDIFSVVGLEGALVLVPQTDIVSRLAAEIERLGEEAGVTVEDLLAAIPTEHRRYYQERYARS